MVYITSDKTSTMVTVVIAFTGSVSTDVFVGLNVGEELPLVIGKIQNLNSMKTSSFVVKFDNSDDANLISATGMFAR